MSNVAYALISNIIKMSIKIKPWVEMLFRASQYPKVTEYVPYFIILYLIIEIINHHHKNFIVTYLCFQWTWYWWQQCCWLIHGGRSGSFINACWCRARCHLCRYRAWCYFYGGSYWSRPNHSATRSQNSASVNILSCESRCRCSEDYYSTCIWSRTICNLVKRNRLRKFL